MSIESMTIALHHSAATGTAKLVLLGIANHDGDGGAWPSMETLAVYANKTVQTARRAVRELEELGEIRVHLQDGGTQRTPPHLRPNRYDFLVRCPDDCDRTSNHRRSAPPITSDSPIPPPPINSDSPPPITGDSPPLSPVIAEPSFNRPLNLVPAKAGKGQGSARTKEDMTAAQTLVRAWFDWHMAQPGSGGRYPTGVPFVAVVKIVHGLLKAHEPAAVKTGLVAAAASGTVSVAAVELAINRHRANTTHNHRTGIDTSTFRTSAALPPNWWDEPGHAPSNPVTGEHMEGPVAL